MSRMLSESQGDGTVDASEAPGLELLKAATTKKGTQKTH